jgi:hypothetical protein
MQILNKEKLKPLGNEQHTYEIIGTTKKIVRKTFKHVFINNNHWILDKINTFALDSHCTIYDFKNIINKNIAQ